VSGSVQSANRIQYGSPLEGKTLTGNKFWDKLSDLEMLGLSLDPSVSTPDGEVLLTAVLHNAGPGAFHNVPVFFTIGESPFGIREVGFIAPDATLPVTLTHVFTVTGSYTVSAIVNPGGLLPERSLANNRHDAGLTVVFEAKPGWARPDLSLTHLSFFPPRPNPTTPVIITATVGNPSRADVLTTTVALKVDGELLAEQVVGGLTAGSSSLITFTIPGQSPGRHHLGLVLDPLEQILERTNENNFLSDYVRVSGEPNPKPDLEVGGLFFSLENLAPGASTLVSSTICNQGYQAAFNLPVAIRLDGHEIGRQEIAELPPEGCALVQANWNDISEGQHQVQIVVDPDDTVPDDSVLGNVTTEVVIPGAQYTTPAAITPLYWESIGPKVIRNKDVGRIDSIAISAQDHSKMVVGAPAGGVWLSEDAGYSWKVLNDRMLSQGASPVAFDPTNDDYIYAATSSGIYKSSDNGAKWTLFSDTSIGTSYGGLILRYITAGMLTIYAGTDTGVWVWQGSQTVTQTQTTDWQHVWQQSQTGESSRVMDMLVTAEATPQLYIAVVGDTVYRVAANTPSNAWTSLSQGFPTDALTVKIGNSPASSDLIYAAVEPVGKCDQKSDQSSLLDIYTRRTSASTWTKVSRPTDQSHICNQSYNAFIRVHPSNADVVYIAGVKGWRSTDGGVTFPDTIPSVHDDYKSMAFDPSDPSIGYFVSDGGVYRCTNMAGTMACSGRNTDLRTTMFYDIALSATKSDYVLGGTQDNGNIIMTGTLSWGGLSYGGDGYYTAFDPASTMTMVVQYQYADSTARTTDGGANWTKINQGLPTDKQYSGTPFLLMHPSNGSLMLITAGKLYRTTDAGNQWNSIGPGIYGSNVSRVDIDATNNRYYAGTTNGQIYATSGASISWNLVYFHPLDAPVAGIQVDRNNPNLLYATFKSDTENIIRLSHSGGWPGTWTIQDRTGDFPSNRTLAGGMNNAIRGLFKDPNADILYVGTSNGVYQGQLVDSQWQWLPDTCGLPLTYISDLEYSNGVLRAATYGRGAFKRTLSNPTADPYDTPTRNDSLATRTQLGSIPKKKSWFSTGIYVENLNFDRLNDVDYFTAHLPAASSSDCLPLGDSRLSNPRCSQCELNITVHAPDNPEALELRMYNADGSVYKNPTTLSYLGYSLTRPRDIFASGQITFSVRSPNSCRSSYDLLMDFTPWDCEYEAPNLLVDAPLFKHIIPELGDFAWMFPVDPAMINRAFTGQAPAELPEERMIFEWPRGGDFQSIFNIEGFGNLNAVLYDANNNPLASSAPMMLGNAPAGTTSREQITVNDLPAGWYALGFSQANFPTWFNVQFWLPRIVLPVVMR
jgi:photosystem II stability/assembly factor-like uncharacterized protein